MKKILLVLLLNLAVFIISFPHSALAADTVNGAKLFDTNCAACHRGGRNLVVVAKTLKKSDLEKYNMNSMEAIVNQVKNGKNAMPAFKNRLNDTQIEEVATYVLEQAEKDWS